MKRGFTFVILSVLVLLPLSSISAQKNRRIIRTQKIQKPSIQNPQTEFGTTEAFSAGTGVYLKWRTNKDDKTIGFMVYRLTAKGSEPASRSIIPGSYLQSGQQTTEGNSYNFYDEKGDLNSRYVIEGYSDSGSKKVSAPFSTRQVENLSAVAGNDEFSIAAQNQTPILETNQVKLPKGLDTRRTAVESLSDVNAHRAIVAMPGVKIGIKKEGFYRVTRAELQTAGFDVNTDFNLWRLFLEGEEAAINIGGNGDYIEFIGKGIDELETDTRVYNLVVGSVNGKRFGSEISRPMGNGVEANGYLSSYIRQERMTYAGGILNGDSQNYFGTAILSSPATINFNLDAIQYEAGKSTMEIKIQGLTLTPHQIQVELNGEVLDPIVGNSRETLTGNYSVQLSSFIEGNNTLRLTGIPGSVCLVDSIKIDFFRFFKAKNNQLAYFTQANRPSRIFGFTTPNVRVFNLTNPTQPKLVTNLEVVPDGDNYQVLLLPAAEKTMIAVEDSGVLSAASVTPNVPSTLSTTTHNADLVIISYKDFIAQANTWADYRRSQGFSVEVVNVEDIYDEFGFCLTSSASIRGFLNYAKNNWQTPPQYVLLIGDASYDRRNYQGLGNFNYVPSVFVDTLYTETPSDESLADFDDDGLSELAIGRIPVRTGQAVTDALNKTIAFELTSGQGLSRGAIFASDEPNGYDFEGLSQRLADQLPANMTKVAINRTTPDSHNLLINQLNNGRFLVNYSGHGRADIWAADDFFSRTNVPLLTNMNNLSIFTMLTCLNGYFVPPSAASESLSEKLLSSTVGGGVAVWSSTGLTTPDIQEVMATRFYHQIAVGNTPRLGDLIKDAKATLSGGRDVRLSWCLLGDPMLKVR